MFGIPLWIVALVKEMVLAFLGKLAFRVLFERLLTRWVLALLYKLASMTGNALTREDVDELARAFGEKQLRAAQDLADTLQTPSTPE